MTDRIRSDIPDVELQAAIRAYNVVWQSWPAAIDGTNVDEVREAAMHAALVTDRSSRPIVLDDERDARGETLRGHVAFLRDPEDRNRNLHITPDRGYVIVDAVRSEGHSAGVPGPLYYRLVDDRKEVVDLLSTLFEIRALSARSG